MVPFTVLVLLLTLVALMPVPISAEKLPLECNAPGYAVWADFYCAVWIVCFIYWGCG